MKKFIIDLLNCNVIQADKILHFCFCYILSHTFDLVMKNFAIGQIYSIFSIISFSFFISLLKEFFDKYVKKSNFCWYDILAGMIGCGFYLLTYLI